ncbi:MAG: hypothetical protein ACI9MF_002838, partial [Gammaproteobacteria bacterium]
SQGGTIPNICLYKSLSLILPRLNYPLDQGKTQNYKLLKIDVDDFADLNEINNKRYCSTIHKSHPSHCLIHFLKRGLNYARQVY